MRIFSLTVICFFLNIALHAQQLSKLPVKTPDNSTANQPDNIYNIRQQYLLHVLHNPTEENDNDDDNDLARFNRWFNDVEVRCYPTGNLPRPDALLTAQRDAQKTTKSSARTTSTGTVWQPVGPMKIPIKNNGIGRVNCIIIDPIDTNTLYIGSACGGVNISHDHGATWHSNTDNFPSLSIADIAVNPIHTDTIYAATGDGYGYEEGYNIFWGGLYSAGVMMSTDGGNTWNTTGLSYLQSDREVVQKLLINPIQPNILLAATRNGISRTTDAGATWTSVYSFDHVYSMAFRPFSPDTIYAITNSDLIVSYDTGATWSVLNTGLNPSADRATLGVSNAAPNAVWLLDSHNNMQWSHDAGVTFTTTYGSPGDSASFYGYYDRVFAISPTDSNYALAFGEFMTKTSDGGFAWYGLNPSHSVHVDNHAVAINPLNPYTIYAGDDGGISVTYNGGAKWKNLANGLMISQIYRLGVSHQNPYYMICGLQDNGSLTFDGTNWTECTGGDGEACAIHPFNDYLQISSSQNGYFSMSYNQGASFGGLTITSETGNWTSPVAFDPMNQSVIYFGYKNIYATYDAGSTFHNITHSTPFSGGAYSLVVAPSNDSVIYAADYSHIIRSTDFGTTWTDVTSGLPAASVAITKIAVDPSNALRLFVTFSGYTAGEKLYLSNDGGATWANISSNLPNIPADCIAVDTSTPGALFVGTDLGVYYTDSSMSGWSIYSTGLPTVIANDLDINYANYKVRVATYGRGIWENNIVKPMPSGIKTIPASRFALQVYPNPTKTSWRLAFPKQKPANYSVKVSDEGGRTVLKQQNVDVIDASGLASGVYTIEMADGVATYTVKAIKE